MSHIIVAHRWHG